MTDQKTEVRIERTLPVPPEKVYRAWLDPAIAQRWFAPEQFEPTRVEIDERVGGRYDVWHADADGEDRGGMSGEIVELVENERIVFAWHFVGPDRARDPERETRLSVELRAVGDDATRLTLVHERLDGLGELMPDVMAGVNAGWGQALDSLERAVA